MLLGVTITGDTSTATGKVISDTTTDEGIRILEYVPLTGIFQAETITDGSTTGTILEVYGLRGVRDRTLTHEMIIDHQVGPFSDENEARPNLQTITDNMWRPAMVDSAASYIDFSKSPCLCCKDTIHYIGNNYQ